MKHIKPYSDLLIDLSEYLQEFFDIHSIRNQTYKSIDGKYWILSQETSSIWICGLQNEFEKIYVELYKIIFQLEKRLGKGIEVRRLYSNNSIILQILNG